MDLAWVFKIQIPCFSTDKKKIPCFSVERTKALILFDGFGCCFS